MKLVFILGPAAVGKMTVGQELAKITGLRLMHNHVTIEPVLEVFGEWDSNTIFEIREAIWRNFALTDNKGLIITLMIDFDILSELDYLNYIVNIFDEPEVYGVELYSDLETRLNRNKTENRLKNKASKRNIEESDERLIRENYTHRCNSVKGEEPFKNYLRIDNTDKTPEEVAKLIKETFNL